jgi:hypothetical protein
VKALSGTGAPVSSPVTSLPRVVGGERNRDGRVVRPVVAAAWAAARPMRRSATALSAR